MSAPNDQQLVRFIATASLITGGLWLLFSLTPIPFTTLLGSPFALLTFVLAGFTRGWAMQLGERTAVRRTTWALGLGCAGCLWQAVVITFFVTVSGSLVWNGGQSLFEYLQGTPTP
ncbi:MAG: hypothetical protein ACT4QE_06965 [Anaerolineales bacterium]